MCDCDSIHPGISCSTKECHCHDVPEKTLTTELSSLLNRYSAENVSGTPDFILAEYLIGSLKVYNEAVSRRAHWRGEPMDFQIETPSKD